MKAKTAANNASRKGENKRKMEEYETEKKGERSYQPSLDVTLCVCFMEAEL